MCKTIGKLLRQLLQLLFSQVVKWGEGRGGGKARG